MLIKELSVRFHVGIDVSKLTLDIFILECNIHKKVSNNPRGFNDLLQMIEKNTHVSPELVVFCFEHTGLYSLSLALYLEERNLHYAMVAPLELKKSLGITRGKNDKVDSARIADYARRFGDRVPLTKLPAKDIRKIHYLLNMRERLVKNMHGHLVTYKETLRVMRPSDFPELFSFYESTISMLKAKIKEVEHLIKTILKENSALWSSYRLITSVKGIGLIVAAYLIVYTCNFTRFDTWRRFSCYSGIAPFEHQSGTSVKGKTQVCPIANRQIKMLLHLSAICALHTDTELREYYQRRQAEGKSKMAIINILRNKLIARVFAVIKRGTPFVDIKRYAAT